MSWLIAICIGLSVAASLAIVPLVRSLAHQFGVVDQPDAQRKLHRGSIALGGGLGVFLALSTAFVATILVDRAFGARMLGDITSSWYILFGAAGAMLLVGLLDDAWELRGRQKLLLQFLIIAGLVASGTVVRKLSLLGYEFELGVFAFPVTVTWLLIAVNALNLIDGADGMAATAACIISAGLGFLSIQAYHTLSGVACFALAGALLGFLVFNRPPASIFLGDAGSMMIGLFVGVLAVWSSVKESTVLASAPVAVLAIPLFDSSAAVVRRWLTGRSIYTTDRAHLHHLLQEKFGPTSMLLIVAALCVTTTTLAVLSTIYKLPWLAALGVAIVFALLLLTRSFGHAECRLVFGRAAHFAQSFLTRPTEAGTLKQHRTVPLQGTGRWETIWEPLVEFAKAHDLAKVKIDLNLAWLHEGYHATWQVVGMPERANQLSVRVPLFTRQFGVAQVPIGRLEVVAMADDSLVYSRISELAERLVDLQPQIDEIIAGLERRRLFPSSIELVSGEPIAETGDPGQREPIAAN